MSEQLPAPLNGCSELVAIYQLEVPAYRPRFRTFVADYWLALAEAPGRIVERPTDWTAAYAQKITTVLETYAHSVGHGIIFGKMVGELNPTAKKHGGLVAGSNGTNALDVQVAGSHYKNMKIQPVEFIHANNIPFLEACVIKRICRWRNKDGIQDLEKIKHEIDLLIQLETSGSKK